MQCRHIIGEIFLEFIEQVNQSVDPFFDHRGYIYSVYTPPLPPLTNFYERVCNKNGIFKGCSLTAESQEKFSSTFLSGGGWWS